MKLKNNLRFTGKNMEIPTGLSRVKNMNGWQKEFQLYTHPVRQEDWQKMRSISGRKATI
jgi:hypothetical protein